MSQALEIWCHTWVPRISAARLAQTIGGFKPPTPGTGCWTPNVCVGLREVRSLREAWKHGVVELYRRELRTLLVGSRRLVSRLFDGVFAAPTLRSLMESLGSPDAVIVFCAVAIVIVDLSAWWP